MKKIFWLLLFAGLVNCSTHDFERIDNWLNAPIWPYQWREYCLEHPESDDWQCWKYQRKSPPQDEEGSVG